MAANKELAPYYDMPDFCNIFHDDDFEDLSFKKEAIITGIAILASIAVVGCIFLAKR